MCGELGPISLAKWKGGDSSKFLCEQHLWRVIKRYLLRYCPIFLFYLWIWKFLLKQLVEAMKIALKRSLLTHHHNPLAILWCTGFIFVKVYNKRNNSSIAKKGIFFPIKEIMFYSLLLSTHVPTEVKMFWFSLVYQTSPLLLSPVFFSP